MKRRKYTWKPTAASLVKKSVPYIFADLWSLVVGYLLADSVCLEGLYVFLQSFHGSHNIHLLFDKHFKQAVAAFLPVKHEASANKLVPFSLGDMMFLTKHFVKHEANPRQLLFVVCRSDEACFSEFSHFLNESL